MEISQNLWKPGFQWNVRLENTFSMSWNTFQHQSYTYSSVIKYITPKLEKCFPKGY